eukprot:15485621-Alexandrium_andersonii.AAC.1
MRALFECALVSGPHLHIRVPTSRVARECFDQGSGLGARSHAPLRVRTRVARASTSVGGMRVLRQRT